MADNRTIQLGGVWAKDAPDPPPSPITETTYANSGIIEATINAGWPYSKIVDSADTNEVFRRISTELILLEQNGIMPWSSLTVYATGAWARASDGFVYRAILAGTNKDPISNPTYWVDDTAAHAALFSAHGSTSAATASRMMERDGAGRADVVAPLTSTNIATLATVTDHAGLSTAHQSTSAATANRIVQRDAVGRFKASAPFEATDVAILSNVTSHAVLDESAHNMDSYVSAEISDHNDIANAHGAIFTAVADTIVLRSSSGTARVAAPLIPQDIALQSTVTADVSTHNLDAGFHSSHNTTVGAHGVYSGQVTSAGASVRLPGGWSSAKDSTGVYTITHNLGHTNYSPVANPTQTFREATIASPVGTNSFQVKTHAGAENTLYQLIDSGFTFILV